VVDRAGGLDQLFSPGDRLKGLDPSAEPPHIGGDGGGIVEVAPVGGPPKRSAQVGQLKIEPGVGLTLSGAVPQGQDVGFASGEVARVGGPNLGCFAAGHELFLGELADRLQHRKPGPPRRPVGHQQRLVHQSIEQIQGGEVIIGTHDRAGTLQVESPGEHRTPHQQRFLRVIEVVGRPLHGVAQRLVACQPAPGADQQPESVIPVVSIRTHEGVICVPGWGVG
jgi:hypothetical protein